MVAGGLPPLRVKPDELMAAGGAMSASAGNLPTFEAPFVLPPGSDPLSAAIAGQIPAIETPLMTQLPLVKAQAEATANSVTQTAQAYVATDARNGEAINQMMQNTPAAPGSAGGGSPASAAGGGADQMSQMMSMPMQMAGQMAQMPMQVMGAVAAVPQGLMQGVQQVGQQVQQMTGQMGQGGATGPDGGSSSAPKVEVPNAELPQEQKTEDGAAAGEPEAERAPDPKERADDESGPETQGRHRAAEGDDRIDL